MPHFTIAIDPLRGPIIKLYVGVSGPRGKALSAAGLPIPPVILVEFLVDTGASSTVVDAETIAPLNLTPTGATQVHTPTTAGAGESRFLYDIAMLMYHPDNTRVFATHPVIATDFKSQGIGGLLGRDVLASCLLVYDGATGNYSLAF